MKRMDDSIKGMHTDAELFVLFYKENDSNS